MSVVASGSFSVITTTYLLLLYLFYRFLNFIYHFLTNLIDGQDRCIQIDCVVGDFHSSLDLVPVQLISLSDSVRYFLKCQIAGALMIPSFRTSFNRCVQENFDFGIRKYYGGDIPALHNG